MKILTVENLSKSFGGIHANRDISFDVEEGSILGVIGPNGDLPAPLGPITPKIDPSSTSKEISLFAWIPPKDLLRFSTVNIFIVVFFFLKYL